MRKIVLLLLITMTFTCGFAFLPSKSFMDYPQYKKVTPENIKSVKIIRYTEGGVSENEVKTDCNVSGSLKKISRDLRILFQCDMLKIYTWNMFYHVSIRYIWIYLFYIFLFGFFIYILCFQIYFLVF